ncbi:hypothetical protein CcaverHIS002_0404780 [Cutaneotrichosporon cavernicola]|uniref:Mediator complex subunit 11 n=1 Tax=Cutaneotrichosporon cavernicola TaxID=279322 RepID=A0AA48L480_9TREE|nr:uncharacterized protein CcaverHIS019_0404750 [Cutaneotrichosporon cavernicola]BEI83874.1 hypothetical protein CcaverHIS002_0404780 [Cutaneotrichosporon cavernicola]BEI91655.1 hypothetical protein CcaverHIS019_0404750 [Cutaneotrichosporon cavernicola]BEI99430.1 hypothetical protein CcaverHIS631_0404730 [Cutaneotrichosporon cavernicola]BEJ07208.1 hypothetical protein CcaverHIS641_0404770 [Cutaneotrichosporon cavernicola]
MSDSGHVADPLDLSSLDTDSLLSALAAVKKAVPDLLLDVKPVLAQLTSSSDAVDEEGAATAREAVDRYMATVDKIQFVLRQSVFFLRETRAAPSVLRPPPADALPRPLAATLRDRGDGDGEAQLGLYALRVEVAALRDMLAAVKASRKMSNGEDGSGDGPEGGDERMEMV